MSVSVRLLALLAGLGAVILFLWAQPAQAGPPANICTRVSGTHYTCTTPVVVGHHLEIRANPGICHADANLTWVQSGQNHVRARIDHNVTACPWANNTLIVFTHVPVSVGGQVMMSMGLAPDGGSWLTGAKALMAAGLLAGTAAITAGGVVFWRRGQRGA